MFCNETSKLILIAIILICKDIQILALDLQLNDYRYDFKNNLKRLKQNIDKHESIQYPINEDILRENDYGMIPNEFYNQMPNSYKRETSNENCEDKIKEDDLQNIDFETQNYEYNDSSPSKVSYPAGQIYRREVPSKSSYIGSLQNSSLYPSVLTKALEISLSTSSPVSTGESLFSNVAQKMNTTTLDLAKKLTEVEPSKTDDQFARIIQKYSKTPPRLTSSASILTPTKNMTKTNPLYIGQEFDGNEENDDAIKTSRLTEILDLILNKLESIDKDKKSDEEDNPEGAPCDIVGSWSSNTMGFCFDIQLFKDKIRNISPAELNNKILSIAVSECIPAKRHQLIDLDWKFTGSAIKQLGGPFYVYGQKRREGVVATFLGFCRKCGGIDTVYGSWNLLSPSKDCHDISLASEVKRDILRRVRMEMKRKERFKNLLYQKHHENL